MKSKSYTKKPVKWRHSGKGARKRNSSSIKSKSAQEEDFDGDLLWRYFKAIARMPVLRREQEIQLARKIQANRAKVARIAIRYPMIVDKVIIQLEAGCRASNGGKVDKRSGSYRRLRPYVEEDRRITRQRRIDGKQHPAVISGIQLIALGDHHGNFLVREFKALVKRFDQAEAALLRCEAALQLSPLETGKIVRPAETSAKTAKKRRSESGISPGEFRRIKRKAIRLSEAIRRMELEVCASRHWLRDDLSRLVAAQAEIEAAKKRFVETNLKLVVKIARRYFRRGLPLLDLIQEGNLGLMRAVETFDHRRGLRFNTYAAWWIRQKIIRATNEQGQSVRIPTPKFEAIKKLRRVSWLLKTETGRKPTLEEIAEKMDLPAEKVMDLIDIARSRYTVSLETPINGGGSAPIDCISNNDAIAAEEAVIRRDMAAALQPALSRLTAREAEVVRRRFGIGEHKTCTLQELAGEFGLSRERVRQIQAESMAKIKRSLWNRRLDFTGD